jgi:DNA polymerase-3 subunit epsilon
VDFDQTHWAPQRRRGPLPTFYYHEHFMEMLDFVATHYAHVLLEEHVAFIDGFRALPRQAQCLYVRLVNRKGRVFSQGKLRYPEIGDTGPLVRTLRERAWVTSPGPAHFEDMLSFLTRDEIYGVLLRAFAGMSRALKKAELVSFARAHCDPADFVSRLDTGRLLVQARAEEVRYILFLYFGRIQDGLSQFTMRDLGLVRTQSFKDDYEPRFSERAEAEEHYFFASRLHDIAVAEDDELLPFVREMTVWPEPEFPGSAAVRDKLAYRLGRKLEKSDARRAALDVYRAGESTQCSERVIRLMLARGQRDEAAAYIERCLEDPRSDEEWLVARDLYERKFNSKRTSLLTDLLREADVIDIDESRIGSAENAAVEHFEAQGMKALRTENSIWRTLFGLLFWDELFTAQDARLHSPFEFLPAALADGSFAARFEKRIAAKLDLFSTPRSVKAAVLKTSTAHWGKPNGVFRWRQRSIDAVFALLDAADGDAVRRIVRRFCDNYRDSRYGYPDLMAIDRDGVRFVEIKAEGDQLRRNQMLRLQQLREAGFRAEVVRVRWVLDPDQAYVVVDVETTGGRGDGHRVTEIGAVRMQNGAVVNRFQTLLNPQRTIPPGITRLTGISAEMVAGAPCFVDIADEFESFMEGAIFVAHNVDFDYGFISREFARMGRPFRYPKLCTCASMRKLYPGHRSYSLAALARAYDIPLKQHHRAMCDAEAAAELLLLINEKRLEQRTA